MTGSRPSPPRHSLSCSNYLIATKSKLAIRYNDVSVLENYHAAEAFQSMQNTKYVMLMMMMMVVVVGVVVGVVV